jgi:integrase
MQTELDRLQSIERGVADRLTRLQSSERERAPRVEILEAAAPSLEPSRPNYSRDALISLASALVFGVLTTWLVDFVGGGPPIREISVSHSLARQAVAAYPTSPPRSVGLQRRLQIPAPEVFPRELDYSEAAGSISNGTDDLRLVSAALLMGLSAEEVVALRWDNIDWKAGMIAIGGETPRRHPLNEPLLSLLKLRRLGLREEVAMVLHDGRGDPLSVEDLRRAIWINKGL